VDPLRISLVNFEIRPLTSLDGYRRHVMELVEWMDAPDVVVFPELLTLEWLSFCPFRGVEEATWMAERADFHLEVMAEVARRWRATVVGGTTFFPSPEGIRHYCPIVRPNGDVLMQPKVKRTQFEIEDWNVIETTGLHPIPPLGVLVCYDSEFPEAGRALAEAGVEVIAVPTYTETARGVHRVRTGCQARALENQVYVVVASLNGSLGREPVPQAMGVSAVYAPMVHPFPTDGVVAQCREQETVLNVTLDLELLRRSREGDDVRNWADRSAEGWRLATPVN